MNHVYTSIIYTHHSAGGDGTLRLWDITTGTCEILRGNV